MNETMSWEDWLAGRRARREGGLHIGENIQRKTSSSDKRLRALYNGQRGLPFKKTEEL